MNSILKYKPSTLIIFHIILGLLTAFTKIPVILFAYVLIFLCIKEIYRFGSKAGTFHLFLAYYMCYELLGRMVESAPFIPYESGKYLFIFFFILQAISFDMVSRKPVAEIGWLLVMLILPSLVFMDFDDNFSEGIVFNFFGFIALILSIFYFNGRRMSIEEDIKKIFLCILYPAISILVFITIKTPDLSQLEFNLGANTDTTGGFGSNQVSTILGIAFLVACLYFNLFGSIANLKIGKFSDTVILIFYSLVRGLLTFSRGGILGGFIPLIVLIFRPGIMKGGYEAARNKFNFSKILVVLILFTIAIIIVNEITDNSLYLRFSGETEGTLAGSKTKDLNQLTTGRLNIFEADVEVFKMFPVFGAGLGKSTGIRRQTGLEEGLTHVESGRILAEHGFFGILILVVLFFFPIIRTINTGNPLFKYLVGTFFFLAVFTSFHAAMRLLVVPYFFGLATAIFYSVLPGEADKK